MVMKTQSEDRNERKIIYRSPTVVKLMTLTPDKAREFQKIDMFQGQRKFRPQRFNIIVDRIKTNLFHTGSIVFVWYKGTMYLVNGQHQLAAVLATGTPVNVVYLEYECHNIDEVITYYRQFDDPISGKSMVDHAVMEINTRELDYPVRVVTTFVSAMTNRYKMQKKSQSDRLDLLMEYKRYIDHIWGILESKTASYYGEAKHLVRGPIFHVMSLSYDVSVSESKRFWLKVRNGEGLTRYEAAYRLREYLRNVVMRSDAGGKKVGYHEIGFKCCVAWNAFRQDKPTRLTYYADKPWPDLI